MPLPTPNGGESKDDFISRCMGDDTMRDEYPDQDQRAAVCYSQWGEDNKRYHARRADPTGPMYRFTSTDPIIRDESRTVRFCFSDDSVDRMGDSIKASGWNYSDFLKNPVALWAHDSSMPPIGRASNLSVENGTRLMGDIEFASASTYPFAETVYQLVKNGYVKAVSVGFIPIEWKWVESKDRPFGMDFIKQELLEISVVPVPANANALIDARAKGIDTRPIADWAERVLEGHGKIFVPRPLLERLRKAAAEGGGLKGNTQRAGDGMSETDPSSGGAPIGNCGRSRSQECGMKDPEECAIHSSHSKSEDEDMDEKAIAALVRREVKAATKSLVADIKSLVVRAKGDDGDGDMSDGDGDDDDSGAEHNFHVKTAHYHAKECMRSLKKALDTTSGDDDDVIAPSDPNPEGEKAIEHRRSLVAALRAAT